MTNMRLIRSAVVLVAAGLLATACSSATDSSPAGFPMADPPAEGSPAAMSAVPVTDEMIDTAIGYLDAVAEDVMQRSGVPGMSVAVVHRGETKYAKGFGVREMGTDLAVEPDTVFQIASLSKPVSATVVAAAAAGGEVGWDTPVVDGLPNFALSNPYVTRNVTVGDMFAHRSGLPDHAGDLLEDLGYDRAQVLERLRYLPLAPFRDSYAYTNFGLTAGAEAVARLVGTPWSRLAAESIFEPLGMDNTSMDFKAFEQAENKAIPYQWNGEEFFRGEQRQPDPQAPAGGVSSTATDLARWMAMVLASGEVDGRTVVDAEALQASHLPQILAFPAQEPSWRSGQYGFGNNVGVDATGRVRISHSGAFLLGTATNYVLLPSEELGIVVLTNGTPVGAPEAVTDSFTDLVEFGEVTRDWLSAYQQIYAGLLDNPSEIADEQPPANPEPAAPTRQLVGTYQNDYYGPVRISAGTDNNLVATLGPDGMEFELDHWSGSQYAMHPRGENAVGQTLVTFRAPTAGISSAVTFEAFDREGMGTFRRP